MVATLADRTDASAALAAEALIEEARRRQRKRWGGWIAAFAALALVAGVLVAVFSGTGGGRGSTAGGSEGGQPFGTCSPCTPQSSASALARGHWVSLPPAPIAPRIDEAAVWTGHRLVIWGGAANSDNVTYGNGATYDPTARRWRMLPRSPLGPRWGVAAVWTGKDVFIWGGTGSGTGWTGPTRRDGAMYDPATHRWTLVPPAPIPARKGATAIWTGHEVVVFGGMGTGNIGWVPAQRTDGAIYNPTTRRWHRLPTSPIQFQAMHVNVAWNGTALVVTALDAPAVVSASWSPGSGRWHVRPTPASLARAINRSAAWTGTQFVYPFQSCPITGGDLFCGPGAGDARAFDPSTGHLTKLPSSIALVGNVQWTGRALVTVDGASGKGIAYDPVTHRSRRLPAGPVFNSYGLTTVWTGRELIEWGGVTSKPAIPGAALVAGRRTAG